MPTLTTLGRFSAATRCGAAFSGFPIALVTSTSMSCSAPKFTSFPPQFAAHRLPSTRMRILPAPDYTPCVAVPLFTLHCSRWSHDQMRCQPKRAAIQQRTFYPFARSDIPLILRVISHPPMGAKSQVSYFWFTLMTTAFQDKTSPGKFFARPRELFPSPIRRIRKPPETARVPRGLYREEQSLVFFLR